MSSNPVRRSLNNLAREYSLKVDHKEDLEQIWTSLEEEGYQTRGKVALEETKHSSSRSISIPGTSISFETGSLSTQLWNDVNVNRIHHSYNERDDSYLLRAKNEESYNTLEKLADEVL